MVATRVMRRPHPRLSLPTGSLKRTSSSRVGPEAENGGHPLWVHATHPTPPDRSLFFCHHEEMRLRFRSLVAAVSLAVVVSAVGISAPAAAAVSYPSWEDVKNARASESAKKAQIDSV